MKYKLTKQFLRGSEIALAEFSENADAQLFIEARLAADLASELRVNYRLYNGTQLIEQWPKSTSLFSQQAGSVAETKKAFTPTPCSTIPRPPGFPPLSGNDDEQ